MNMAFHKRVLIDKEVLVSIICNSEANRGNQSTLLLEPLHLLMEFHMQSATGPPVELLIQVTDESNPQLLLTANISEKSYQSLRSSQGLLVDFNSFPLRFSELIEKCLEDQQMESSRFVLVLRVSGVDSPSLNKGGLVSLLRTSYSETSGVHIRMISLDLEVVERNRFKELCHLSLSLVPASLETKLAYLSSCLKDLKNSLITEREKSVGENAFLIREIERLKVALQAKTEELNNLNEEMNLKINFEVEKNKKLLLQEKEIYLKSKSDFDRRLSREKRELEEKMGKQIGKLRSENLSLKKKNGEHCSNIGSLQLSLQEQQTLVENMSEEIKNQSVQLNELFLEKSSWSKDLKNLQDKVKKSNHQIANQEKYIQEKEKEIQKNKRLAEKHEQEKIALETRLQESLAKLEKRENTIKNLFQEFHKSLAVIQKVHDKEKILEKEKLLCTEKVKCQEILLIERDKEVKKYQEEHENSLQRLAKSQSELDDTKEKLKDAMEKVQQQENSLRNNENVIARLSKQLNELESLGSIMKKAPLAEAYLHPQHNFSPTDNIHVTSTPASASVPAFGGSLSSRVNFLTINDGAINDIPPIPEEVAPGVSNSPENKENAGLDDRYLEPMAKALPVRGIIRASALTRRKEAPHGRGGGTINLRGQKKPMGKQPSTAYYPKKS